MKGTAGRVSLRQAAKRLSVDGRTLRRYLTKLHILPVGELVGGRYSRLITEAEFRKVETWRTS